MGNKYHNHIVEYQGIKFDSIKEKNRWIKLCEDEAQGIISELQRQVDYLLIPKQELKKPRTSGTGRNQYIELPVRYTADFQYRDAKGELVVEDVKSPATRTEKYIIKRKLMKYIHGIEIKEI